MISRIFLSGSCLVLLLLLSGCQSTSGIGLASSNDKMAQQAVRISNQQSLAYPNNLYLYRGDLWESIRSELQVQDDVANDPAVQRQIRWYLAHPDYLKKASMRAKPFLYYIVEQVRSRHMPIEIALLPMIESAYHPFAVSKAGAQGLWQFMPSTASGFDIKINWWYDGRRDLIESTESALGYLKRLYLLLHNDWLLALTAYDAGEGKVIAAMKRNFVEGKPMRYGYLNLSNESNAYVPKLLALAVMIKHPEKYKIKLMPIDNIPYLVKANVGSQIDLAIVSKLADMPIEELAKLNAGYTHWVTDPKGEATLLLPIDKIDRFQQQLKALPISERVHWKQYELSHPESLEAIAQKFNTTAELIKQVNPTLKNNKLLAHQIILIPKAMNFSKPVKLTYQKRYEKLTPPKAETKMTEYVVQEGETLKSIAKKHHTTQSAIQFWNHLKAKQEITAGQKLILWPTQKNEAKNKTAFSPKVKAVEIKKSSVAPIINQVKPEPKINITQTPSKLPSTTTPTQDPKKSEEITTEKSSHKNRLVLAPALKTIE